MLILCLRVVINNAAGFKVVMTNKMGNNRIVVKDICDNAFKKNPS